MLCTRLKPYRMPRALSIRMSPNISLLLPEPVIGYVAPMLQLLRIRNFAIVEDVVAEFEPGLNVITGETGAGKSILIGALGLLLGERADRQTIRAGEAQCMVQAVFHLADGERIDQTLETLGVEPCDQGALMVQRTVLAAGGGKIFVNNTPITLQSLKTLGDMLVDMHGPHDHQSLLRQDFQMDLLDAFGGNSSLLGAYRDIYGRMAALKSEVKAVQGAGPDMAAQRDMLAWQIREIEEADLADLDEAALENEHSVASHAQRILELIEGCRQALTDGDGCAFDGLGFAQKALDEMTGMTSEANEWLEEARSAAIRVQELSDALNRAAQNIDSDPRRLEWLETRMALLFKLKRKYGASVPEIQARLEQARQQLYDLDHREERLAELVAQLADTQAHMRDAGAKLSRARKKSASSLSRAVAEQLRDLGFPHGGFEARLHETDAGPSGLDEVEFGFAPNVGEAMRPLRKIASSGEISRVMLAIKAVLSEHDRIPVLVFDEVDANVGGEMGVAIGEKLAGVAKHRQVLCITHLPQVAVYGATHWVVEKQVEDGRTHSRIRAVSGRAREEEVARMLGGRSTTDVTFRHAREMLQRGAKKGATG